MACTTLVSVGIAAYCLYSLQTAPQSNAIETARPVAVAAPKPTTMKTFDYCIARGSEVENFKLRDLKNKMLVISTKSPITDESLVNINKWVAEDIDIARADGHYKNNDLQGSLMPCAFYAQMAELAISTMEFDYQIKGVY